MHMTKPASRLFLVGVVSSVSALACGIAVKRDLSTVNQGQVGYDDMCNLQEYFDSIEAGTAKEPVTASSIDLEGGGDGQRKARGGQVRLVFEGDFLVANARRVLEDNFRRLPKEVGDADKIELEAKWAERAGVKRLVTNEDATLIVGDRNFDLPYHVCLSELLFGAPLYRQRQVELGLPDPKSKKPLDLALDAGAPDAEAANAPATPATTTPAPTTPAPAPPEPAPPVVKPAPPAN
jgi:hypothetical protein